MNKKRKPSIPLSQGELIEFFGKDWVNIQKHILTTCYCGHCSPGSVTIVDYVAEKNDLGDIVLEGSCKRCGKRIARYIEME